MKTDVPFCTENLHLAAALKAAGCTIQVGPRPDGRRCEFTATPGTKARKLAAEFVCSELKVAADVLFVNYEDVRTMTRLALGREVRR